MKFLLVDDDERITLLMEKKLKPFGSCLVAKNGGEAIDIFGKSLRDGTGFDAVFMDIAMPGMDGHEVVKKLRQLEKEHGVPELSSFKLIMISAFSDTKNVCKSFFHGYADAYVSKGDISARLIEELRNIKLVPSA